MPPESIDISYCNDFLEHLHPDDVVEQLQNIHKALAPGGIFISITPNSLNGPHDISRYFDKVATGLHLKEYTTTELYFLLKSIGFSRVKTFIKIKENYFGFPLWLIILTEKLLLSLPYSVRIILSRKLPIRILLPNIIVGFK